MDRQRSVLFYVYIGLALLALVACWRQNLLFMQVEELNIVTVFIEFWPALFVNHATSSITVDIFVFGAAAFIWMVPEARRLEIRGIWIYILFSFMIAISVMFPLFLAMRERALEQRGEASTRYKTGEIVGLAIACLPILVVAIGSFIW